ncbi:MAG: putative manganese-dependent inorganic diphosphatase [Lachnospiraceae bacterium]|jgi:manganese-dependent inorganic pyrophosphatase|nr:putative manganese-dependent inorganic diphosphatase [Lachnospiraceae bacterium]
MDQNRVYVTGHKHPDTDSVASAIGYAFYKRANGIKAVPCRLGKLSAETKYLLKRFGFEQPMLLEDARFKLGEIDLDEPVSIAPDKTLREAIQILQKNNRQICGVVNKEGKLLGIVTRSDAADISMGDTDSTSKLLQGTPPECISKAIDGRIIYNDPLTHINGKVGVIPMTSMGLDQFDVKERIVITGDDPKAQEDLIRRGAGVLIVVRAESIAPNVIEVAKEYHCSVIISGHGTMNTSRYVYFAPRVSSIMTDKPVKFYASELVEDAGRKMLRSRFHAYPVIDDNEKLLGYVSRYHVMNTGSKKLILVDHNEFAQSVKGIEKAEVLEVIDHHRINDFSTNRPVAFRNEIIGSSATIVATIFRENQIPLPKNLAGLILGAILSDTLKFQSPTTTPKDIATAQFLAGIAGLDIDEFAMDMFSVSANIKGKTVSELLNQDIKFFNIDGCKTMISQVIVTSADTARAMEHQVQDILDTFTKKKGLDLCLMVFTSILENGSVVYASGDKAMWAFEAFPNKPGETRTLQTGMLSRKSQILPRLTAVVQKYS